jgi:transcriptional regulator with XRE-family HTH domain
VAVEKLKAWRAANKLSQRQAAAVMGMYDLPVSIPSIQSWEQGVRTPGKLAARALEGGGKDSGKKHTDRWEVDYGSTPPLFRRIYRFLTRFMQGGLPTGVFLF